MWLNRNLGQVGKISEPSSHAKLKQLKFHRDLFSCDALNAVTVSKNESHTRTRREWPSYIKISMVAVIELLIKIRPRLRIKCSHWDTHLSVTVVMVVTATHPTNRNIIIMSDT